MEKSIQEIVKAYTIERKSIRDIAKFTGRDRVTIRNILIKNNVPMRSRIESMCEKNAFGEDIEKDIVHSYQTGYLPHEIRDKFNIGMSTIFRILKKYNINTKGKLGFVQRTSIKNRVFIQQTEEFENKLIHDYKTGFTTQNLEEKYNVSKTYICRLFTRRSIESHSLRALTDEKELEAMNLYKNTDTPANKIAKQFDVTLGTLYNIIKRREIPLRENNVSPLVGMDKEITDLYNLGESAKKIADRLSSNTSTIGKILNRNNTTMRDVSHSKQIYKINEFYFDTIDTEDRAYFLGFLYADGTNSSSKTTVRLGLKESDVCILNEFSKCLNYGKPLYYSKKKYKDGTYKGEPIYTLSITNKHISQQLYKLGVVDRKTFILEFPKWLAPSLYSHFIRGYFDGDGSISGIFSLAGTKNLLMRIQEILMENCALEETKISPIGKIYILSYGGSKQLSRIREFLYKDATIFLERKKVKFDEIKILEKEIPIEPIIQSFEEGKSNRVIAEELNINESTVSKKLKERGFKRPVVIIDEDEIIRLYTQELKTCNELGEQFNVCHTTVLNILKRHKIKSRDSHTALKTLSLLEPNKDEIIDLYTNRNKSAQFIADKFGCNQNTVIKFLAKNNIKMRERYTILKSIISENKEEIIRLYAKENISTEEIAKKYNVTGAVVRKFLKRWSISSNKIGQHSVEIKKLYKEGLSSQKVADLYKVSKTTILNIVHDKY